MQIFLSHSTTREWRIAAMALDTAWFFGCKLASAFVQAAGKARILGLINHEDSLFIIFSNLKYDKEGPSWRGSVEAGTL